MIEKFFWSQEVSVNDKEQVEDTVIQILKTGDFHHQRYGKFSVTPEVMDRMIANFPGPDRIPLDYNHGSLNPDPEKSRAAGWVDNIYKEDDGLGGKRLMAKVRFTEKAKEFVGNGEFRYISPEFTFNRTNQETGAQQGPTLLAAALTNRPFLPAMAPITLNDEGWFSDIMPDIELASDDSLTDMVKAVTRGFYREYPDAEMTSYMVRDVREDNLIVEKLERTNGSKMYQVSFSYDPENTENAIEFDAPDQWQEVRRTYEAVGQNAVTDTTISSNEKEIPKMDKELLSLLGLKEDAEDSAVAEAVAALVDKAEKVDELELQIDEIEGKVRELTEMSEEADEAEVSLSDETDNEETLVLAEKNDELTQKLSDVEDENIRLADQLKVLMDDKRTREADDRINMAVRNRKLLPAEVDGADAPMRKLALNDPESFDAIIEAKPSYDKAVLELTSDEDAVNSEKSEGDSVDEYWKLWDKLSGDNPQLKSHEVRGLIDRDHPEVAKAAGI